MEDFTLIIETFNYQFDPETIEWENTLNELSETTLIHLINELKENETPDKDYGYYVAEHERLLFQTKYPQALVIILDNVLDYNTEWIKSIDIIKSTKLL